MWQKGITGIWLLMLSVSDIRKKSIPIWMFWVGLTAAAGILFAEMIAGRLVILSLLAAIWPGILFLGIAVITKNVGYGDGIALILLGLMSGQRLCQAAFMAGLLINSLFGIAVLILKKARKNTCIPFLPFLTIGWVIVEGFQFGRL